MRPGLALSLAVWMTCGVATARGSEPASVARSPRWAVRIEKPGLPNLHKVGDGYYRGAQPTSAGVRELAKLGVRTIVNLRALHSDRRLIGDASLSYEHIGMTALHAEDEDVVRFLRVVTDLRRQPVFVHCQHGADRTGLMTAVYRIVAQRWSKDEAIREMTDGGFGYHSMFSGLVDYLRRTDLVALARTAGIRQK